MVAVEARDAETTVAEPETEATEEDPVANVTDSTDAIFVEVDAVIGSTVVAEVIRG